MRLHLLLAFCPLVVWAAEFNQPTINICDLAQDLGFYDGRIVAVRGTYFHGPHGATIAAEKCRKRTAFKEFGSGIAISLDANLNEGQTVPSANGQSYAVNRKAIEEFYRIPYSDGDNVATFIGVLHVRSGFKMRHTPRQGYEGNGYGLMGRYPAELSLISIREVVSGAVVRK